MFEIQLCYFSYVYFSLPLWLCVCCRNVILELGECVYDRHVFVDVESFDAVDMGTSPAAQVDTCVNAPLCRRQRREVDVARVPARNLVELFEILLCALPSHKELLWTLRIRIAIRTRTLAHTKELFSDSSRLSDFDPATKNGSCCGDFETCPHKGFFETHCTLVRVSILINAPNPNPHHRALLLQSCWRDQAFHLSGELGSNDHTLHSYSWCIWLSSHEFQSLNFAIRLTFLHISGLFPLPCLDFSPILIFLCF